MKDLSIVIVNWNAVKHLARCLASVYAALSRERHLRAEVIVVENASTDGSARVVKRDFPQARLIENSVNLGFAAANNQAISEAKGTYVLLLNPDTDVGLRSLGALVDFMQEHPEAGAAGSRLLSPDGGLQHSCSPSPTLFREFWRLLHLDWIRPYGIYDMTGWQLDSPREVEVLQGACLIVRRQALDEVGLLDEDYFIYTEEVDLCFRLRSVGWKLFWVPQAEVVHYGGQSTGQAAETMFLQLYRSKVVYFRKRYGLVGGRLYKLILFLASTTRLLAAGLAILKQPGESDRYAAIARNYQRLLVSLPAL